MRNAPEKVWIEFYVCCNVSQFSMFSNFPVFPSQNQFRLLPLILVNTFSVFARHSNGEWIDRKLMKLLRNGWKCFNLTEIRLMDELLILHLLLCYRLLMFLFTFTSRWVLSSRVVYFSAVSTQVFIVFFFTAQSIMKSHPPLPYLQIPFVFNAEQL